MSWDFPSSAIKFNICTFFIRAKLRFGSYPMSIRMRIRTTWPKWWSNFNVNAMITRNIDGTF